MGENDVFSAVVGWMYFVAWSVSFYPQVWMNFRRKSVVGLSFDFEAYNLIGFTAYSIFNCAFLWAPSVQQEYKAANDGKKNLVQINDAVFALHATLLTVITIVQIFIYDRGSQKLSLTCRLLSVLMVTFAIEAAAAAAIGWLDWLDVMYFLSYEKLFVTVIKYVPQAYLNYRRKSTVGWNIWNVLLDFTGGTLSIVQLLYDGITTDNFAGIIGDPVKFGLGFTSMVFDILFMIQHYILYRENNRRLEAEDKARIAALKDGSAAATTGSVQDAKAPLIGAAAAAGDDDDDDSSDDDAEKRGTTAKRDPQTEIEDRIFESYGR